MCCLLSLITLVLLGLAIGGMLYASDRARFLAALSTIPYGRLWWGAWEIVFYLVCMWAYLALWKKGRKETGGGTAARVVQRLLAVLAATNLAYHFPPLFTVASDLRTAMSAEPGHVVAMTNREFLLATMQPVVVAHWIHFLLASLAVTGVVVMRFGLWCPRACLNEAERHRITVVGARLALVPTVLQLLAGTYLLFQLPAASQEILMGGNLLATSLFGVSVLLAIGLMHRLATASLGQISNAVVAQCAALLCIVVVLMTFVLQMSRTG